MDVPAAVETLRSGELPPFPAQAKKRAFAEQLDAQDVLAHLRDEFIIPTKGSLRKKALSCKYLSNRAIPSTSGAEAYKT